MIVGATYIGGGGLDGEVVDQRAVVTAAGADLSFVHDGVGPDTGHVLAVALDGELFAVVPSSAGVEQVVSFPATIGDGEHRVDVVPVRGEARRVQDLHGAAYGRRVYLRWQPGVEGEEGPTGPIPSPCAGGLTAESFDYDPGEHEQLTGGNCWADQWAMHLALFTTAEDLFDYTTGSNESLNGGVEWADEWTFADDPTGIIAEDEADGYTVGTGDAPYSAGLNLTDAQIAGTVEIVTVSGSDLGFSVDGAIAWKLDGPSFPARFVRFAILCHVPASSTIAGTPLFRAGFASEAGGIPGFVADGSVGHARFVRSSLSSWTYSTNGSMSIGGSGGPHLGEIVAGVLSTANFSGQMRIGAIGSAPENVRLPFVVTLDRLTGEVLFARRTTSTGSGIDRPQELTRQAAGAFYPAGILGTGITSTATTAALDEATNGTFDTFFIQTSVPVHVSAVWVANIEDLT